MRSVNDLIIELKAQGINHPAVLKALAKVPRADFVERQQKSSAFDNTALPIDCQQTISQPYIVALMTQQLLLHPSPSKILEIGTGSGYQTAILAELFQKIYTIERIGQLHQSARTRLDKMKYHNIDYQLADGHSGWLENAPYHGILVTACAKSIPPLLLEQLDPSGGVMVIPVSTEGGVQKLKLIQKHDDKLTEKTLEWVAFVLMQTGVK